MHHANHFYGHAHIMARYVGLVQPPRIWGYLQHGWNNHDGFAVGTVFAAGYPKFVWSEACIRRGWLTGLRDYMVVAAPWLYMLQMEEQEQWLSTPAADEREGTIVYPFHGWEGQQIIGDHKRFIDEIREAEGDVPITMCLYWNEYENPKIRAEYEDAGLRVITHGLRGYLWKDTEPAFLYRQLDEMRRHKRVVSNRMTSAILYGAMAGNEVGVYGDPMELESDHAILGGVGKQRRMWPELHQFSVPRDYGIEIARDELGADVMLTPEEIIDVFRWVPEIGRRPKERPPAPPLDEDGFWRRRRTHRRGQNSRVAPSTAEVVGDPTGLRQSISSSDLDSLIDQVNERERGEESQRRHGDGDEGRQGKARSMSTAEESAESDGDDD